MNHSSLLTRLRFSYGVALLAHALQALHWRKNSNQHSLVPRRSGLIAI